MKPQLPTGRWMDVRDKRVKKIRFNKNGTISVMGVGNPSLPASEFKKCVAEVTKSGTVRSPRGVCAKAGRKKYGKKKFAKMARAGKVLKKAGYSRNTKRKAKKRAPKKK